jgi:hypothetical protein
LAHDPFHGSEIATSDPEPVMGEDQPLSGELPERTVPELCAFAAAPHAVARAAVTPFQGSIMPPIPETAKDWRLQKNNKSE